MSATEQTNPHYDDSHETDHTTVKREATGALQWFRDMPGSVKGVAVVAITGVGAYAFYSFGTQRGEARSEAPNQEGIAIPATEDELPQDSIAAPAVEEAEGSPAPTNETMVEVPTPEVRGEFTDERTYVETTINPAGYPAGSKSVREYQSPYSYSETITYEDGTVDEVPYVDSEEPLVPVDHKILEELTAFPYKNFLAAMEVVSPELQPEPAGASEVVQAVYHRWGLALSNPEGRMDPRFFRQALTPGTDLYLHKSPLFKNDFLTYAPGESPFSDHKAQVDSVVVVRDGAANPYVQDLLEFQAMYTLTRWGELEGTFLGGFSRTSTDEVFTLTTEEKMQ